MLKVLIKGPPLTQRYYAKIEFRFHVPWRVTSLNSSYWLQNRWKPKKFKPASLQLPSEDHIHLFMLSLPLVLKDNKLLKVHQWNVYWPQKQTPLNSGRQKKTNIEMFPYRIINLSKETTLWEGWTASKTNMPTKSCIIPDIWIHSEDPCQVFIVTPPWGTLIHRMLITPRKYSTTF